MSPRTRHVLLAVGLALPAGCGAPPQATTPDPPAAAVSPAPPPSLPPVTLVPLDPATNAVVPPLPTYTATVPTIVPTVPTATAVPTIGATTATTTATTTSPTPLPKPSHAPKCSGEPTGAQILALIKDNPAVPDAKLKVADGPYCSGTWSFTTVTLAAGKAEPLSVVTTGKGSTLAFVTAGTDVCNPRVQAQAPVGIRVLACGF